VSGIRPIVGAFRRLALVIVAAALVASDSAAQSAAQSTGRAELRTELTAVLVKYVEAFSAGRIDFLADSVYTAPAYFSGGGGIDVRMTRDDVADRFREMWAPLPAQGYDRSDIRGSDVCVLNDRAALVTLDFARVRADGSVMIAGTAIYLYVRTPEGWRVSASLGSGPRIECED